MAKYSATRNARPRHYPLEAPTRAAAVRVDPRMIPLYTKTLTVNVQTIHIIGACTVLAIIGLTIVMVVRR